MTIDLNHLTANWKSTAQSLLTTTFAVTGVLMVSTVISPKTAGYLVAVNGVCKVVLGVFQNDGAQIPTGSTVTQASKTAPAFDQDIRELGEKFQEMNTGRASNAPTTVTTEATKK